MTLPYITWLMKQHSLTLKNATISLKMNDWAFKWKISFNPNHTKPATLEVVFRRKRSETHYPLLMVDNVSVKRFPFHKDLGLILVVGNGATQDRFQPKTKNPKNKIEKKKKKIVTATGLEPTTTQFVNKHSTIQPNVEPFGKKSIKRDDKSSENPRWRN